MLSSCAPNTRHLQPVGHFEPERYLGRWFEIARLPHRFEKNLVSVTANYSLREDGSVEVLNHGYDSVARKWKTAKGRAYFKQDRATGLLKVTFFWPFYGDYKIIDLDSTNYSYALVTSGTFDYLWILSRSPELEAGTLQNIVQLADKFGFNTSRLEYVTHNAPEH